MQGGLSETGIVQAVRGHIMSLGWHGDIVRTAIHPFLRSTFGMSDAEAQHWRRVAMHQLTNDGLVRRVNVRGNLEIL